MISAKCLYCGQSGYFISLTIARNNTLDQKDSIVFLRRLEFSSFYSHQISLHEGGGSKAPSSILTRNQRFPDYVRNGVHFKYSILLKPEVGSLMYVQFLLE